MPKITELTVSIPNDDPTYWSTLLHCLTKSHIEVHCQNQVMALNTEEIPVTQVNDTIFQIIATLQDITQLKQTEQLLYTQQQQHIQILEERLQHLANNTPGVLYQWYQRHDQQCGFHYLSPRCKDYFEVTATDWQRNWQLLRLHPEDQQRWSHSIQQAIAQQTDWTFEGRFILPSGTIKWWKGFAKPVIKKEEIVFDGIILDITQQKKLENILYEKEKILADAQRMALVGSWVWDIKTGTVYRSEQDCRNYALSPDNYIPSYEAFVAPVHPDDKHLIDTMVETCIIEGKTTELEFRVIWPDGQIRTLRSQTELELDDSGTPIRLKGFSQDITDRKQVENILQKRTNELEVINQVIQIFNSTLQLDQVLEEALKKIQNILEITGISFWVKLPETGELICQYARGPASHTVIGYRLAPGQGLTGQSAQMGKRILVSDTRLDPRHHKGVDKSTGIELRSVLSIPLLSKGEVMGVLNVVDEQPNRFKDNELRLLEPIAITAANAIENARLYQLTQQELLERKRAEQRLEQQNLELLSKNQQLENLTQKLAEAQKEKLFQLNKAYERFVPRQFLSLLDKESVIEVELGDQVEKEITVLFADIRGFTALSENMQPQDIFDFINNYMGQMEPVIMAYQGIIDKYIGDAIMALFPNNADDAVQCSIRMLHVLKRYNIILSYAQLPLINIGIGLNSGPLILGTVGGVNRMDGTVIADAVNLASRVQDLTKVYNTPLVITEKTYLKLINPSNYCIRVLDIVKVKGKSEAITVYEVYDADSPEIIAGKKQTQEEFELGFVLYHSGEVQDAYNYFQEILILNPKDKVNALYLERCKLLLGILVPENFTLLIVDDDLQATDKLVEFLSEQGFKVLVAENGAKALEIVKYQSLDLILLAMFMPGLNGFEICEKMKLLQQIENVPVIFSAENSTAIDRIRGFELGAIDYINKPFHCEEVLSHIKIHLRNISLQQRSAKI